MLTRRALLLSSAAFARSGRIQLGVCSDAAHFEHAVRYGFDYYEPDASEISELSDEAFAKFKARVLASPIRCRAFRSFVRKLKVVGPDVRQAELHAYVERTLQRCREVGAEVIVFGSSGARNVPAGFRRDQASVQIRDFLRFTGGVAQRLNMVVGIEPLRRQESNILNTAVEALAMMRAVNHPGVKIIVDYYHLRQEKEDPEVIWQARRHIVHFHFANPNGRTWPKSASEDSEYLHFFRLLRKMNYRRLLTLESPNGTFEADGEAAVRFFRELLG